jgi:prepilin-type processing-associated H-X9-DG protein
MTYPFAQKGSYSPPITGPGATVQYWTNYRLCVFGSGHSGGANFAFGDGSIRFINESVSLPILQALATRAGGEPVSYTD